MDSILVFPPGPSVAGSQLQIGTYLQWDPGADYGAKGLIQSMESSNALRDGGVFAYRSVGPRKMAFPLLLRDVPGQTLLQTESLLREWTTAGAAVAVQPETVPSGQAVFFDVLDGRWEPDYDGFHNRAGRRKGTLYLDTQPWGYWPTEMLLASAASIGFRGQLAVNGASVLGDVPPLARIFVNPTSASIYPVSSWYTDTVGWSLGGRASFAPLIPAASFVQLTPAQGINGASLTGNKFAPASQAWQLVINSPGAGGQGNNSFGIYLQAFIPSALEPAYRGRFRVFGFSSVFSASTPFWQTIADAQIVPSAGALGNPALATGNQIATAAGFIASAAGQSGAGATSYSASPAFQILDLGELTLPPGPSGIQQTVAVRLGGMPASSGLGTAAMQFGGLFLLPVDGAAGILPNGLFVPSIGAATGLTAALALNTNYVEGAVGLQAGGAVSVQTLDGRARYRGVAPRLGASTQQLVLLTGDRTIGATAVVAQASVEFSQVSVSYRPQFQFLSGL